MNVMFPLKVENFFITLLILFLPKDSAPRNYRIFRPITRVLSIQKGSKIVKNEHARYTLERFPTDNVHVICTKKAIGKYGIMY